MLTQNREHRLVITMSLMSRRFLGKVDSKFTASAGETMPPKPAPPKKEPSQPKQTSANERFNLDALRTNVDADIEKAIAATRANRLPYQVVFVTGGANGLGRAIVKAFAKEGSKVAILDRDQVNAQACVSELCQNHGKSAVSFFNCNLEDSKSLEAAVMLAKSQLGRFDILVNNAGCFTDSIENFERSINLNFKSVVHGSLLAVSLMGARKGGEGGLVINIADTLAYKPAYLTPIYAATKAAVIKFTSDMGASQNMSMTKVGFISILPNAFKGSRMFDEPANKLLISGRDMFESFRQSFDMSGVNQTSEQVAQNIIKIIKAGERSGSFVIENGEDYKKVEPKQIPTKSWLPEKL